jgi:hypothetical protein
MVILTSSVSVGITENVVANRLVGSARSSEHTSRDQY